MVVGSGMMGSGIGAMSALAGNRTILVDVDEAHVRSGMEKAMACIDLRVGNGLNTAEEAEEAKKADGDKHRYAKSRCFCKNDN